MDKGAGRKMWWEGALATLGKAKYPTPAQGAILGPAPTPSPNSPTAFSRKPSTADSTLGSIWAFSYSLTSQKTQLQEQNHIPHSPDPIFNLSKSRAMSSTSDSPE